MSKKISAIAVFTSLALIFGYIEAVIPFNFGIPGVKLGLANIVTVTALYYFGAKEAVGISLIRVLLIGLLFGNAMSLIYSLSGAVLSLAVMILCKKLKLSTIGVSAMGGVFHNVGQLIAAAVMMNTSALLYYYPVLFISGLVTGIVIGVVSDQIIKRIKKRAD
ncbi:MAG: Gx transporter family protein [Ruminococcus sp.]|nr:Gx transporter family protein [Ruminococcus sp.]